MSGWTSASARATCGSRNPASQPVWPSGSASTRAQRGGRPARRGECHHRMHDVERPGAGERQRLPAIGQSPPAPADTMFSSWGRHSNADADRRPCWPRCPSFAERRPDRLLQKRQRRTDGDDTRSASSAARLRPQLIRFSDEALKHQALFRRIEI